MARSRTSSAITERPRLDYLARGTAAEILDELYAYLAEHNRGCLAVGCSQCERFARIREILLEPFVTVIYAH
jgi:hypothetical protein